MNLENGQYKKCDVTCRLPTHHYGPCGNVRCSAVTDNLRCEMQHGHNTLNHAAGNISWANNLYIPSDRNPQEYNHYFKNVEKYVYIDVYRVLELFSVSDPCLQHAIKKLLVAGGRGNKDMEKDIKEAIVSLKRWEQMRYEDSSRST